MNYYLAPMEGVTTYIYRRAYHMHFRPMEKYFTPFLVPHTKRDFNARELKEILPENHEGMYLVPQILTNDAQDFLRTAERLREYGYEEVNLNLGCPSKTVASKYRGSGFLIRTEELDRFLDEIYGKTQVKVSVKTRIGRDEPEEFEKLLKIYNSYPIEELIIHPRVQKDFYKNTPRLEVFAEAVKNSRNPVCYNGDLFTAADMDRFRKRFPQVKTVMLGRGIICNPGLAEQMEGEAQADLKRIRKFHDQIYADYQELAMGNKNVLFKMKELWSYLGRIFPDCEKTLKKIRKSERLDRYEAAVDEILPQV